MAWQAVPPAGLLESHRESPYSLDIHGPEPPDPPGGEPRRFSLRTAPEGILPTLGSFDLLNVFLDYQAKLKRLLAGRLQSFHTAEDLAQDLYFKLPRVSEQFPSRDDAQRYLVRMALNAAMDHQRVEGRRAELLAGTEAEELFQGVEASPEDRLISRDEIAQLEESLRELPPKCRDVLYMSRVEGMTHAEIAEKLGVSKSLVDKYAVRALIQCRARLKGEEAERRSPAIRKRLRAAAR